LFHIYIAINNDEHVLYNKLIFLVKFFSHLFRISSDQGMICAEWCFVFYYPEGGSCKMKPLKALFVCSLVVAMFFSLSSTAMAIPQLQIYIEGATYDTETEKWVVDASSGDTITLWVIGNVSGPGGQGGISDVHLVAAYQEDGGSAPTIDPTQIGGGSGSYDGFTDDAISGDIQDTQTGSGLPPPDDLAPHGVYGEGTSWTDWSLGDFTDSDDSIADFNGQSPLPTPLEEGGQINAYDITLTGDGLVYFDVYGTIPAGDNPGRGRGPGERTVFAPYSHVARTNVPEPATALLLGAGLIGIVALGRKKLFK
jgi:hypothetical protein